MVVAGDQLAGANGRPHVLELARRREAVLHVLDGLTCSRSFGHHLQLPATRRNGCFDSIADVIGLPLVHRRGQPATDPAKEVPKVREAGIRADMKDGPHAFLNRRESQVGRLAVPARLWRRFKRGHVDAEVFQLVGQRRSADVDADAQDLSRNGGRAGLRELRWRELLAHLDDDHTLVRDPTALESIPCADLNHLGSAGQRLACAMHGRLDGPGAVGLSCAGPGRHREGRRRRWSQRRRRP